MKSARGKREIRRFLGTILIFLALGSLLCAADKKRKSKGPEVEIVSLSVRRSTEGTVGIEGRVRNAGERPLTSLNLLFSLIAPGKEVMTTQRGVIDEELLEPGQDCEFHWMVRDHVRAVQLSVAAEEGNGHELNVKKPGPYAIE